MLELSKEQINELEKRVLEKLCPNPQEDSYSQLYEVIVSTAIRSTIATIREYEQMKENG